MTPDGWARDGWALAVVVPARDEEATIGATLRSLRRSIAHLRSGFTAATPVVLCVVADRCADDTVEVARRAMEGHGGSLIVTDAGSVGAARAVGAAHSIAHSGLPAERTWIASTDADTTVPAGWLRRHLDHAARGVACVAGIVELDAHQHPPARFDRAYRARIGAESHGHVHGANLGIRADALLEVGNWPLRPTGEDRELWRRVGEGGMRRLADPRLVVTTSGRTTGRAPRGFAADLRRCASLP